MKKIIISYILCVGVMTANTNEYIDRSGWHFGIGVSLLPIIGGGDMFEEGKYYVIPTLDLLLDYGISKQFSIGFESKNLLFIGNNTLHLKYYTVESKNSTFFTGGVELAYPLDDYEDNETTTLGIKAGVGYAWNHTELEASIHYDKSTYFDLSWRYKF